MECVIAHNIQPNRDEKVSWFAKGTILHNLNAIFFGVDDFVESTSTYRSNPFHHRPLAHSPKKIDLGKESYQSNKEVS